MKPTFFSLLAALNFWSSVLWAAPISPKKPVAKPAPVKIPPKAVVPVPIVTPKILTPSEIFGKPIFEVPPKARLTFDSDPKNGPPGTLIYTIRNQQMPFPKVEWVVVQKCGLGVDSAKSVMSYPVISNERRDIIASYSPNNRYAVGFMGDYAGFNFGGIFVLDVQTGVVKSKPQRNLERREFFWSPSGRYVAYSIPIYSEPLGTIGNGENFGPFEVWDCETGKTYRVEAQPDDHRLNWLGDDRLLFTVSSEYWKYSDNRPRRYQTDNKELGQPEHPGMTFDPLGAWPNVCVVNLEYDKDPRIERHSQVFWPRARMASGSPDGRWIALIGSPDEVKIREEMAQRGEDWRNPKTTLKGLPTAPRLLLFDLKSPKPNEPKKVEPFVGYELIEYSDLYVSSEVEHGIHQVWKADSSQFVVFLHGWKKTSIFRIDAVEGAATKLAEEDSGIRHDFGIGEDLEILNHAENDQLLFHADCSPDQDKASPNRWKILDLRTGAISNFLRYDLYTSAIWVPSQSFELIPQTNEAAKKETPKKREISDVSSQNSPQRAPEADSDARFDWSQRSRVRRSNL